MGASASPTTAAADAVVSRGDLDAVVVGAGLSGLRAAELLVAAGRRIVLLEARSRLGGRILSLPAGSGGGEDRFDLGPAWFWPGIQPRMRQLVAELGLRSFSQHEQGLALFEHSAAGAPRRVVSYAQEPASVRLAGGMAALVDALAGRLPPGCILTDQRVVHIERCDAGVRIEARTAQGGRSIFTARTVILALPPRLAAAGIAFVPPWPDRVRDGLLAVPTWMAAHAKFVAVYDRPFWRAAGLSGAARSLAGPLAEIHDASVEGGLAALFGFVGLPPHQRAALNASVPSLATAQLVRLFGADAASPRSVLYQNWAADGLTATGLDQAPGGEHPSPHAARLATWSDNALVWAGSETASGFGGYLEGALEAAEAAVASVLVNRKSGERRAAVM